MRLLRLMSVLTLLCTAALLHAAEFSGKVVAVMDGDTLMVLQGNKPVKVRLTEIDAPEKAQPYGEASRNSLSEMVMGKQIQVSSRAIDDYGRMVAMLSIDGLNVNHEQVRRGMAWEYSRFHNNREVLALQREAQLAKRGLWAGDEIIEPSKWRKLHPSDFGTAVSGDPACAKKQCSEMSSCEEARDYMNRCGLKSLDGDSDGIPCEALCLPQQKIRN